MMLFDMVDEKVKANLKPKTLDLLKTTRPPRHAFIVFEIPKVIRRVGDEKMNEVSTGLCFLNVEYQPDQLATVRDIMESKPNAKVICYGNFPSPTSPTVARQKYFAQYNETNGQNPFEKMQALCDMYMGNLTAQNEEVSRLKAELAALKTKQEKTQDDTKSTNGKNVKGAAAKDGVNTGTVAA